jgi:hypothetical protein
MDFIKIFAKTMRLRNNKQLMAKPIYRNFKQISTKQNRINNIQDILNEKTF